MPLTNKTNLKTFAQELMEKAQIDAAGRETVSGRTWHNEHSFDAPLQTAYPPKATITRAAKSPYYSPYLQPTNGKAIEKMNKLGADTERVDKEFFDRYAWLKQHARMPGLWATGLIQNPLSSGWSYGMQTNPPALRAEWKQYIKG